MAADSDDALLVIRECPNGEPETERRANLLNHAGARVPNLLERTTERLRQRNGATTAASSSRRPNET